MIAAWTMGEYTLLDPWFLLAIPLAVLAALSRAVRKRAALPTASAALFAGIRPTLRQQLAWLPLFGKVLAAVCLGVALARPCVREVAPLEEHGIDILLAIDVSSSMQIDDMDTTVSVQRIEAARKRAEQFAKARTHDRVGMIAFARFAELRCPLTLDEKALGAFLRAVEIAQPEAGLDGSRTAIGVALAKAVQILAKSKAKSKVVVLLTDGDNNIEDIMPADAAKLAKDAGVRVHTIGLGNGQMTPLGFQPLDFKDLKLIADTTGGQFFQPKSDEDLAKVYARIDELEKSELEDPRYRTVDFFEWPLAAGLSMLLLALFVEVLWFRRVP